VLPRAETASTLGLGRLGCGVQPGVRQRVLRRGERCRHPNPNPNPNPNPSPSPNPSPNPNPNPNPKASDAATRHLAQRRDAELTHTALRLLPELARLLPDEFVEAQLSESLRLLAETARAAHTRAAAPLRSAAFAAQASVLERLGCERLRPQLEHVVLPRLLPPLREALGKGTQSNPHAHPHLHARAHPHAHPHPNPNPEQARAPSRSSTVPRCCSPATPHPAHTPAHTPTPTPTRTPCP